MIVIRTWEDMARALDSPLEPKLMHCLQGHLDRLSEWQEDYDLGDLVVIVIVQAGDALEQAESAICRPLVRDSHFTLLPELIEPHGAWLEATFILSDDGFGLVLLAEQGPAAAPQLMAAFSNAAATLDIPGIR